MRHVALKWIYGRQCTVRVGCSVVCVVGLAERGVSSLVRGRIPRVRQEASHARQLSRLQTVQFVRTAQPQRRQLRTHHGCQPPRSVYIYTHGHFITDVVLHKACFTLDSARYRTAWHGAVRRRRHVLPLSHTRRHTCRAWSGVDEELLNSIKRVAKRPCLLNLALAVITMHVGG